MPGTCSQDVLWGQLIKLTQVASTSELLENQKPCFLQNHYFCRASEASKINYTAIPYRASTGPEQGFPCVLFPHKEKPVFITGFPGD